MAAEQELVTLHGDAADPVGDAVDGVFWKSAAFLPEPAEVGHRATSLGHLGQIAIQVGGKLQWDPEKEQVIGNDKANAMIDRPIHAPKR